MMRYTFFLKGFLFIALLGFSGSLLAIAAENKPKVAVIDFKTVGESANVGENVSAALRTALVKTGNYIVIERGILKEALKRQHADRNEEIDQNTAESVGKTLKADRVAIGSVAKTEMGLALNIRFVDVETGEVMLQKKLTAQSMEDIPDLCGRIVAALSKREALQEPEKEYSRPETNPRDNQAGNWALGGIYPGASLKYVTGGKSAWELRAQAGSGILALGPRYYRYFTRDANPRLFFGIEADYITFKGKESKGAGFAGGAFLGGEIFLTKQIGLLADVGPMYINLAETDYSQSASNMEYVLNMAIYWHFR
ncbi:MAG: CsgG/HfaB family protein [Elusimicrobia bacterium]|nr:CsgG/HfaB family protein [Elusimicrobiota bacterium]